jgi:integrase
LSTASINSELALLHGLFNYCLEREWIDRSAVRGIKRYSGVMQRRVKSLTPEQEQALIAACRSGPKITVCAKRNAGGRRGGRTTKEAVTFEQEMPPPRYLAPLVVTALYGGFRKGTMVALRWKHIDFKSRRWRIPGELVKTSRDYEVPVADLVLEELKSYRDRLRQECLSKALPATERLGPEARIFGLDDDALINKSFKSAAKRAGMPELRVHDCRRIYLNKLRQLGVSLETAMALTGHRSVATVLKHYREVPEADLEAAVNAVGARGRGSAVREVGEEGA